MKQGEFFEFDKTTEEIQSGAGKALYEALKTGYRFLDPQDNRNNYTKEQIFQDKVADYMDSYEVGFLDDETKAEMTEQEIIAHHNQAYRETQEFLAREILGKAIRDNNDDVVNLAVNHIMDIKDVQFQTAESNHQFDNIVEFATYAEAQAGRVELGDRSFDFHASTDTDVMGDVMRIAGDAYGKEEAQKMRAQAFMDYGFAAIRSDDSTMQIHQDESVSIDVEFEDEVFTLTYEENEGRVYEVKMDRSFESLASKICESRGLGEIHPSNMLTTLTENGALTEANQSIGYYLRQPETQKELASIRAENAAQGQADQLFSMISARVEVGQKEVKAFLNHTASILGENEDLITKIQKGSITADSEEMQKAVRAAIIRQQSSMETLGNQVLNDPKVAKGYTDFIADKLQQVGGESKGSVADLVNQAGNTKQLDADLQTFEADALKRGVSQENIDSFKGMVREGASIIHGVHQASQRSGEPSERLKAIETSLVSKGIPQEALDEFKNKILGNQEGRQAAQNKPVFTNEDSAAFVDAVENTTGGSMQTYEDRLQKNTELARDQGFAAMHETVEAMKGALKGLSPTDLNPSSKSAFYKARGAANDALDGLYRNNGGISNSPEKMAKLMSRMEGLAEGTFSKNDQGGLQFKFDRGIDARAVTSVANSVKDYAASVARVAAEVQKSPEFRAYIDGKQEQKEKNLGLAKDLGVSAVPFAVDALKGALKDMSPTGHTKDSANTFYKARKSASEALESMIGLPNGKSAPELNQKTGDLLTRAEDTLGGKFSKSDDGRLKFEFKYPVDARLVTSVANKAKGLAEDVVKEAKSERAVQQPAAQAPKEAPIETSSTGRITGGGRFSRPPSAGAVARSEPEPQKRAQTSGRSL